MNNTKALSFFWKRINNSILETINDIAHGKKKQKWILVNHKRLQKILNDSARYGFVRDEKGLDKIKMQFVKILAKIYANTILESHTVYDPDEYINNMLGYEMEEEELEKFYEKLFDENYLLDEKGNSRTSDLIDGVLGNYAIQLLSTDDADEVLLIIDRILNTIHGRGTIAHWFVKGGQKTLDKISGKKNIFETLLEDNI